MSYYGDYEDQAFIAELYDLIPQYASRRDYEFYANLCLTSGGKVLEPGCGTGRVLIPVAAAGCEIVGLDLSQHMLAKCRERLASQSEAIQNQVWRMGVRRGLEGGLPSSFCLQHPKILRCYFLYDSFTTFRTES